MKIPFKPYKAEDADIFTVDAIHQKYWKDFCDVCYPHFGFEEKEDGERTYEQKYDTFRRCYIFAKQHFKWNEVLWFKVHDHDFERFKKAYDFFIQLCTEDHASIPMLLVLLRMQQSIWENLKRDGELMEYIYPRKCTINYEKYSVDFLDKFPSDENLVKDTGKLEHEILDALYQERPWDEEWKCILEGADVHHVDEFEGERIEWDENVGGIVQQLAECILHSYNNSIYEFSSKYYNIVTAKKGSVVRALVFRLFTSYQISLQEVKTIFDDYPEHLCVKKLEQTRESLIAEFKRTKLGTHWCECKTSNNGLEKVGKYLINHRDSISEEEEARFFYLLDEICIITDILGGNAAKYWLNVEYEESKDNCVNPEQNNDKTPYPESPLDSIFHRALNVAKVKKSIADIIIMKGDEGKFRLTLKQTFILHKVLEEIDWLDDDTDTTFIQWFDDVFKWPWKTRDFKSVLAPFKHSLSTTWDENTVNDPGTGREYRQFADYVREQFVDIGQDGTINDKVAFMNLGTDGKPMYIGHGLKRNL